MNERPREVYDFACSSIGLALADFGFRYLSSKHELRTKQGDFSYTISFQSSRYNTQGQYVALWIHCNILSAKLKKWRSFQNHPYCVNESVAGGQIGNLTPNHPWLEWDLADPKTRDAKIEDAIATIKKIAFPYFDLFGSNGMVKEMCVVSDIPSFSIGCVIEYLLCFESPEKAELAGKYFLLRHNNIIEDFKLKLVEYKQNGLPTFMPNGWGSELAYLSLAYDLNFITL